MTHLSRIFVAVWVAASVVVFAGDDQKCNGTARECEQQIRQFLGGRRFLGATITEKKGLVVQAVTPNGPAERAGLQAGDRLIACNFKSLTSATPREFKQILADARQNGMLRIIVWRRGAYKTIVTRLEPYTKEQIDKIISQHLSQSHPSAAGAHR